MINNICDNNKLTTTKHNAVKSVTFNTAVAIDKTDNVVERATNGIIQTTYENGIWYSERIDKNNKNNTSNENCSNNKRNVCLSNRMDILKKEQQQQQHQQNNSSNDIHSKNNECDIIIVDMENDDNIVEEKRTVTTYSYTKTALPKYYSETNMKFFRKPPAQPPPPPPASTTATVILNTNSKQNAMEDNITKNNTDNVLYHARNDNMHTELVHEDIAVVNNNDNDDDIVIDEEDDDSLASMETLSDNVSIWINGEKHWVAGVDANTTCSDLIWALLNYQNGQQPKQQQQQKQHTFTTSENYTAAMNNNQHVQHNLPYQECQQQQLKLYDKHDLELNFSSAANQVNNGSLCTGNKPNLNQNNVNTITNCNTNTNSSNNVNCTTSNTPNTTNTNTTTTAINQSMPINTKENCNIIPNSTPNVSSTTLPLTLTTAACMMPPTLLPLTLPPGITTVSQLATEYVIVKQYHHCEEYLDGSTKVFDVLPPPRHETQKKECELLLRHLGPAPTMYANNTTPQLSSLISTDKDSGMGSPVGSARSAKFRRRKHKSSQWLAQANTLHPKLSRCSANERLMKIILAQDETIQRQLSLLREKERQITKIEEEKHRKRERELGKNYLLETYLNGLDEAECEPEVQDGEEIFIDEPYLRQATSTTLQTSQVTAIPGIAITPKITAKNTPAAAEAYENGATAEGFHVMTRHKIKEKEVKKEKKKKRHKEKQTTKEEGLHAGTKDFNGKTNKTRDKEKVDQQQQHIELNVGNNKDSTGNEQEIEMQILWLEKIYGLNKQLQKEEELAAKLHAKVRKHQLRKAQQTQKEVQMEIDKLDNNLALQCGDIRKVEAHLMQTNEQLQKKLLILERLSIDYLKQQQQQEQNQKDISKHYDDTKETSKPDMLIKQQHKENPLKNENTNILTNLEKSLDIQKLSLNNINSKEEVKKLEKIIAKPSIDLHTNNTELKDIKHATPANAAANTHNHTNATNIMRNYTPVFKMPHNQILSSEYANRLNEMRATFMNDTLTMNTTNCTVITAATDNQQQTLIKPQFLTPLNTRVTTADNAAIVANTTSFVGTAATSTSTTTTTATTTTKTETLPASAASAAASASSMFIDKNMLSSLQVQNAKTIKKQMFHTQTTTAIQQRAAVSAKAFNQQQHFQHIPTTATTFLTSRPQNSHQIPTSSLPMPSNIIFLQHNSSSSSSPLIESSTTLIASPPPPISTSPSPSIMAMNTVDISQLGTLV